MVTTKQVSFYSTSQKLWRMAPYGTWSSRGSRRRLEQTIAIRAVRGIRQQTAISEFLLASFGCGAVRGVVLAVAAAGPVVSFSHSHPRRSKFTACGVRAACGARHRCECLSEYYKFESRSPWLMSMRLFGCAVRCTNTPYKLCSTPKVECYGGTASCRAWPSDGSRRQFKPTVAT